MKNSDTSFFNVLIWILASAALVTSIIVVDSWRNGDSEAVALSEATTQQEALHSTQTAK
jgi:hypothetical protein